MTEFLKNKHQIQNYKFQINHKLQHLKLQTGFPLEYNPALNGAGRE
jgi:hypothetical protein